MAETASPTRSQRALGRLARLGRTGARRYLLAYVVVAVSLPASLVGVLAAAPIVGCSGGLECVGWIVFGYVAGVVGLVTAVVTLGWRVGLGWPWGVLTVGLCAAALAVPIGGSGAWWAAAPLALVTPAVAAWVTAPDRRAQQGLRVGLVAVLASGFVIGSAVVTQLRLIAEAEERLAAEGVMPIGLGDDAGWSYRSVHRLDREIISADRDPRGFYYQMDRGPDGEQQPRIAVTVLAPGDAELLDASDQPPQWFDSRPQVRREVGGSTVEIEAIYGDVSDADVEALMDRMEPKDIRWLATRDDGVWRVLRGGR